MRVLRRIPLSNIIHPISGAPMKIRVCLAVFCFLSFHCPAADGQTPKRTDRSAEWEYRQLSAGNPSDAILNHFAKDGWEIAAATGGDSYYRVILKRHRSHPLFGTQTSETPSHEPPQVRRTSGK